MGMRSALATTRPKNTPSSAAISSSALRLMRAPDCSTHTARLAPFWVLVVKRSTTGRKPSSDPLTSSGLSPVASFGTEVTSSRRASSLRWARYPGSFVTARYAPMTAPTPNRKTRNTIMIRNLYRTSVTPSNMSGGR